MKCKCREGRSYYYEYFFSVVKFKLEDVKELMSTAIEKQLLLYHKDMLKEDNMKMIDQISYLPLDESEKELIRKNPKMEFLIWGSENQNLKKEGEINDSSSSDFENPKLDIPNSEHSKSSNNKSTINMSHNYFPTDDDDDIYNRAHEKLVQLSQLNPKVISIAKYFFATGLDIITIVATLDMMIDDDSLLNGAAIVQQMTWCIRKANSNDGISDFPVYFVNGLKKQVQFRNIQSDAEFETSLKVEVGEMIHPDNLPQVPLHNWLKS